MDDTSVSASVNSPTKPNTNKDPKLKQWFLETRVSNPDQSLQEKHPYSSAHGMNRELCMITGGPGDNCSFWNYEHWINLRSQRAPSTTLGCYKNTNLYTKTTINFCQPWMNWKYTVNSGRFDVQDSEGNYAWRSIRKSLSTEGSLLVLEESWSYDTITKLYINSNPAGRSRSENIWREIVIRADISPETDALLRWHFNMLLRSKSTASRRLSQTYRSILCYYGSNRSKD